MSRRTKLLITALFLVLLGIPVGYAILFWSVDQPLRFRCVTALPQEMAQGHPMMPPETVIPLIFEVENTKPYPVYLSNVIIREYTPGSSSPDGYFPLNYHSRKAPARSSSAVPSLSAQSIPAHGVTRFEVLMNPAAARTLGPDKVRLIPHCASPPRKWAIDAQNWLRARLPEKLGFAKLPPIPFQNSPAALEGPPVIIPRPVMSSAP
ncbi:hypothetical protein [Roseimicrobium sp. ORNL1]|uniref:hypothetical protein n=1 Tax=Roseimicrobium sp. ORNL1 TaxID=2711231 RepID=UPI0013E0F39A|nr:hypothetical protein [Roseimicrobium sp. ORNL1]QIF01984.1 hypothetical protein G5S37_10725 [Roseimicrobium sp. ORNL1]